LHRAIRQTLREGIDNRGTSISHFRDGEGSQGSNQLNLRVYGRGRDGQPCPRCGRPLSFTVIGGRSSHYCPRCQR
jgi:formamidopyrimidine-DNA glycosylase